MKVWTDLCSWSYAHKRSLKFLKQNQAVCGLSSLVSVEKRAGAASTASRLSPRRRLAGSFVSGGGSTLTCGITTSIWVGCLEGLLEPAAAADAPGKGGDESASRDSAPIRFWQDYVTSAVSWCLTLHYESYRGILYPGRRFADALYQGSRPDSKGKCKPLRKLSLIPNLGKVRGGLAQLSLISFKLRPETMSFKLRPSNYVQKLRPD